MSRHVLSPAIAPVTYKKLGLEPGQQGFWDSSVASTVNGAVNTLLVIGVVAREPRLLTLRDAYFVTEDTCFMVVLAGVLFGRFFGNSSQLELAVFEFFWILA